MYAPVISSSWFIMASEWACEFQVKLYLGWRSEQVLLYSPLNEGHPTAARLISPEIGLYARGLKCIHLSVGARHRSQI